MQDIADILGVSKGTVSLVLSGKAKNKRVSEELCKKIRATAASMNYQPNEIARGLRMGRTNTIGIIVADISNEFFGQLTFHMQEHAKKHGYAVIITNTNESCEELNDTITLLTSRQVDGIIAVPADNSSDIFSRIIASRIPMVQLDRYYEELDASYVVLDNYGASAMATRHLLNEGCRRVAMIRHSNSMSVAAERFAGFRDTLLEAGLYDSNLVREIDYYNEDNDIREAIEDFHRDAPPVDGIFFHSHELFITGTKEMMRLGIRIPEDVRVACFDQSIAYALADFPVTYIEQPIKEIGEKAVDILFDLMNGVGEPQCYRFEARICTV